MKKENSLSITTLIGIILVIIAIVSAGGLYFVASEYAKISETLVVIESGIHDVSVTNTTDDVTFHFSVYVNNTSELDIEVYRVEYDIHSGGEISSNLYNYQSIIVSGGTGSLSNPLKVIPAGETMVEIPITVPIKEKVMTEFMGSTNNGTTYLFIDSTLFFNLSKYPDVIQKMDISNIFVVVVQHE
jgi:hypothetical protein